MRQTWLWTLSKVIDRSLFGGRELQFVRLEASRLTSTEFINSGPCQMGMKKFELSLPGVGSLCVLLAVGRYIMLIS